MLVALGAAARGVGGRRALTHLYFSEPQPKLVAPASVNSHELLMKIADVEKSLAGFQQDNALEVTQLVHKIGEIYASIERLENDIKHAETPEQRAQFEAVREDLLRRADSVIDAPFVAGIPDDDD